MPLQTLNENPDIKAVAYAISAAVESGKSNLLVNLQDAEYKVVNAVKQFQVIFQRLAAYRLRPPMLRNRQSTEPQCIATAPLAFGDAMIWEKRFCGIMIPSFMEVGPSFVPMLAKEALITVRPWLRGHVHGVTPS